MSRCIFLKIIKYQEAFVELVEKLYTHSSSVLLVRVRKTPGPIFANKTNINKEKVMKLKKILAAVSLACGAFASSGASATLYTSNYGGVLPGYFPNDDNSFEFTLPSTIAGFSAGSGSLMVSNNGIIHGIANGNYSSIYAFAWDLYSRNDPLGVASIHYTTNANEAVLTWDRMGLFWQDYSQRYTFQMVFRDNTIGLFYDGAFPSHCAGPNCITNSNTGETMYFDSATGAQVAGFANQVPEPGSLALIGLGLAGLAAFRKKKAQS